MKRIFTFVLALLLILGCAVITSSSLSPQKLITNAESSSQIEQSLKENQKTVQSTKDKQTSDKTLEGVKEDVSKEEQLDSQNTASSLLKKRGNKDDRQIKFGDEEQKIRGRRTIKDKNVNEIIKKDNAISENQVERKDLNSLEETALSDQLQEEQERKVAQSEETSRPLNEGKVTKQGKRKSIGNISKKRFTEEGIAEQEESQRAMELCVVGTASKSVSPDCAKITAVIETLDSDIVKSKDNNFQIFDKVVSALKTAGLSEDKIVLDSFISYPNYDYSSGKSLTGYYTITTITFDVDNIEDIKSLVDSAVENGVTSIRNIQYCCSNMDEVYQEVLMMAIENAKEKAEKIGGTEMQVKSVKEEYVYSCSSLYRTYAENISNALVGSIDVQARVNVEFE